MSLANYLKKELGPKSAAAEDLFARLDDEVRRPTITLSPVYNRNGVPPYFTRAMETWYKTHIQPIRGRAIEEVSSLFESKSHRKSGTGFLFEKERDSIEADTLESILTERQTFMQRKDAAVTHQELSDKKDRYDGLCRELGRDAKKWTPFFYWTILFAWMVPEFLINWESFSKIPVLMNTPALVLGSVILVAGFFAASSHILGTLWKQRQDKFGGGVSATERKKSRLEFILAMFLFLLGMGIVVWGRYMLITDLIREKIILKGQGLDTEDILYTVGALLGNIGVWVAGIWWSYTKHDSVPGFSELRTEVESLQSRMLELYEKHLTGRNQRHILAGRRKIEQLQRSEQSQSVNLGGYRDARERFGALLEKDQEAAALLGEYKSKLVMNAGSENPDLVFIFEDITKADLDPECQLSADQFASAPLQLRYVP